MATLITRNIDSLTRYIAFIEQQEGIRWYRGCGVASYGLIPSLYRHPQLIDPSLLLEREVEILKRFKLRSIPYVGKNVLTVSEPLSILFLMQHYRVPTRLLDWTENPYIALYFALTEAIYKKSDTGPQYVRNVAVWVLDPILWNGKALNLEPSPGIISPPNDYLLNGYLPSDDIKYRKPEPVALYGDYNSPRIVAQRGVFTLFGNIIKPMENLYIDNDYPQDCLIKLIIRKVNIKEMLGVLGRTGITDSVVFPDLEGLAKELKRQFGYWV
jgi:hypothetical protein